MSNRDDRYTLITGGSKGIGYELAKLFAKDNNNLLLVARDLEKLKEVKEEFIKLGIKVEILNLDLSKEESILRLFNYVEDNNMIIENVINNAGVGSFGYFKDIESDNNELLIKININALTRISKYFLPKMIEENRGGILNVSSTAAFCAGPKMGIYYASKSYVLNLTEAIHEECRGYHINISCLCPGPVRTEFQSKAGIKKSESAQKYLMEAEEVARIGYNDFKEGKAVIIPGFRNKLLVIGNKFLPRSITRKIIMKMNN